MTCRSQQQQGRTAQQMVMRNGTPAQSPTPTWGVSSYCRLVHAKLCFAVSDSLSCCVCVFACHCRCCLLTTAQATRRDKESRRRAGAGRQARLRGADRGGGGGDAAADSQGGTEGLPAQVSTQNLVSRYRTRADQRTCPQHQLPTCDAAHAAEANPGSKVCWPRANHVVAPSHSVFKVAAVLCRALLPLLLLLLLLPPHPHSNSNEALKVIKEQAKQQQWAADKAIMEEWAAQQEKHEAARKAQV